jgi:hypothetical protein
MSLYNTLTHSYGHGMVWCRVMYSFLNSRISYRPYICYFRENPHKSLVAAPTVELSMAWTSSNIIGPFFINTLISMLLMDRISGLQ